MIDFNFIEQCEGLHCQGYIPENHHESGVHIACGLDLSVYRKHELLTHGLPETLVHKLSPYLGLKNHAAVNALRDKPLEISEKEAVAINKLFHRQVLSRLKRQWPKSSRAVPFEKLPDECQTVVASVAHQYGNLSTRTPHFWHQCTTGDWHDAYNNLMHFGDHYTDRRHKEAHLLGKCLGK
ncbi:pesticin C-terminus-like muramidase [Vibrio quintilis]|uniref:Pesticin C-terminal domain-containing protein n=1 Tax=Vibrio quintilis TaxID=1117707 RepID=A0A1M7Z2M6_9VIBR|nr:pesticin C-terminus-like muramidase [Vibrio quintilis]SHO59153.1 hypothetical protein VQ7734_04933 [Vibrio quintilis]